MPKVQLKNINLVSTSKGESQPFPFPNALAKTFASLRKLHLPTAKFPQSHCPVQGFQETRVKCMEEMV